MFKYLKSTSAYFLPYKGFVPFPKPIETKLKPFSKIIMGLASGPSLKANIVEAIHIALSLSTEIIFVYGHEGPKEHLAELQAELKSLAIPPLPHRFIERDGPLAQAILSLADEEAVDLILVGAEAREGLIRYYKGSLARQLLRKAECSIMLLNDPSAGPKRYQHIVTAAGPHPKTMDTLQKSWEVALAFAAERWSIVSELASKPPSSEEEKTEKDHFEGHLQRITGQEDLANAPVEIQTVFGKGGYSLTHYTKSEKGDLLTFNSPDTVLGYRDRVFTKDLEYILSQSTSDLLIVHSSRRSVD